MLETRFSTVLDFSGRTYLEVSARGEQVHLQALIQQIAFLCAAFGSPEEQTEFARQRRNPRPTTAKLNIDPNDASYRHRSSIIITISGGTVDLDELMNTPDHSELKIQTPCWHYVFRSFNLVQGFPIPHRTEGKGVELPLDLMMGLSRVWYPLECCGTTIFKGFSTALVPITRNATSIQWHLLRSDDPHSTLDAQLIEEFCHNNLCNSAKVVHDEDELELNNVRHFLGLWGESNFHLGTTDSGYDHLMESQARNEPTHPAFAREGLLQFGLSHAGIGFNLSGKYLLQSPIAATLAEDDMNLLHMIENSYDKASILYDEKVKLAYLVPELTLIYHCILASTASQKAYHDLRDQALDKIPKLKPSPDGSMEVANMIREYGMKEIQPQFLSDPAVHLGGAFMRIWKQFQKRKDSVRMRMREELRRMKTDVLHLDHNQLPCWDLFDLISRQSPSYRRQIPLNPSGGRWYEIARDNIDVLIFVFRHIDNHRYMPIRPARPVSELCDEWSTESLMERSCSYLLASTQCINSLTRPQSGPRNISPKHFCGRYPHNKVFEYCDFESRSSVCNYLQSLETNASSRPLEIDSTCGALLFGENRIARKRQCRRATEVSEMMALGASHLAYPRPIRQSRAAELETIPSRRLGNSVQTGRGILAVQSIRPPRHPDTVLTGASVSRDLRRTPFDVSSSSVNNAANCAQFDIEDDAHNERNVTSIAELQPISSSSVSQLPRPSTTQTTSAPRRQLHAINRRAGQSQAENTSS